MQDPPDLFERTCLPFVPDCRAFALSLARNPHDADDLVQETFLRAWRAFHTFTPGTNAKAWLFTILRRIHVDRYRRGRLRPTPLPEDELTEMAGAIAPVVVDEDRPWDHLGPDAVERALDHVPDPFRQAVRLRDLDGLTYKGIGEILDVPQGTVMSRLHRGREYLKQALVQPPERPSGPRSS